MSTSGQSPREEPLPDFEKLLQEKEAKIAELTWYLGERDAIIAALEIGKKELSNQLRTQTGQILALRSELEDKRGLLSRIRNLERQICEQERMIDGLQFENAGLEFRLQEPNSPSGLCR